MAPSQLKQLKASIQERRNGAGPKKRLPPKSTQQSQQKKRPKSLGEETRRLTLLPELQRRHKVGGIIDRRIGENDPTMTPEDRALQRYAKQRSKRDAMFNLEDGEEEDELTHGGQKLVAGDGADARDDFEEGGLGNDGDEEGASFMRPSKRRRLSDEGEDEVQLPETNEDPERRKSKKEVMEEVMAKSKFYKYERQQAREEDDELREELDKGLPDLLTMLRNGPRPKPKPAPVETPAFSVHPDRAAQMEGGIAQSTQLAEKEYDKQVRQMALDKKAQPTERTKTEEEKAQAEAARLKELEYRRQRRMKGEQEESDDERETGQGDEDLPIDEDLEMNEAAEFGLGEDETSATKVLEVEDEDDFVIDEDLVASGSEIDTDFSDDSDAANDGEDDDDDDEDFLTDVLDSKQATGANADTPLGTKDADVSTKLAYTYPCPRDHEQLLGIVKDTSFTDLPIIIQRIRALYHPQLHDQNKAKVSDFSVALVEHLSYLGSQNPPLAVIESLIRHLHSLSRTYPDAIATAFRDQLKQMHERQTLLPGDLFILTATGSIYPTSDHFHQVVTPAITIMARWLGMMTVPSVKESITGAYVVALCLKYQSLAKRYIPEIVRFTNTVLKLKSDPLTTEAHINNLTSMFELWSDKPSFTEIFSPTTLQILESTNSTRATQKLRIMLSQARLSRRPLELHHHRPLPIKSSVPKFEESFNPDKHYDPDRERAEASKLRAEYKREKKGALRELRKDASFLAREKLKRKKEADVAYETKQRRLIAEIQGEEGREANAYEREKRARKGARR